MVPAVNLNGSLYTSGRQLVLRGPLVVHVVQKVGDHCLTPRAAGDRGIWTGPPAGSHLAQRGRGGWAGKECCATINEPWDSQNQTAHADTHVLSSNRHMKDTHVYTTHKHTHHPLARICI